MVHRVKALRNWCFWIVLDKTLECPLDSKIKPVHPKGNQPWTFTGRTDVEAPILWPPDAKSQLTGKDPDAGKDRGQEEKGVTVVRWHHWLKGRDFEQTLGDGEVQGSLACCSPWDCKESDTTRQLNNNKKGRSIAVAQWTYGPHFHTNILKSSTCNSSTAFWASG